MFPRFNLLNSYQPRKSATRNHAGTCIGNKKLEETSLKRGTNLIGFDLSFFFFFVVGN